MAKTVVEVTLPLELCSPSDFGDTGTNLTRAHGNPASTGQQQQQQEGGGAPGTTLLLPTSPGLCQVYAFLPVRPVGLPFSVHADWLLPSSREDVLAGEAWNQALREQVPAAWVAGVHAAVRHPATAYTWMTYLPNPSAHVQVG